MRMLASNRRGLGPIPDPDVTNKLTLLLFPCLSTRVFSTVNGVSLPCNKQKNQKRKKQRHRKIKSTWYMSTAKYDLVIRRSLEQKVQFLHLPTVEVSITCNKVENP